MPLPDIPIQAWIEDQQKRFREATDPYFDALHFGQQARMEQATIPLDWPMPGGEDQWQAAEQGYIEDEQRRQQQVEEEQRRQAEAAALAQQQAEEEQKRQAAYSLAAQAGIPTPDSVVADFQAAAGRGLAGDNTSTTGAFDAVASSPTDLRPLGPPERQYESTDQAMAGGPLPKLQFLPQIEATTPEGDTLPPRRQQSVVDRFSEMSKGMMDQVFGLDEPTDPDQGPHESGYKLPPGTPIPIQNDDGSVTTERTITVTDPDLNNGRPTNIPTVWGGMIQSDDDAVTYAVRSGRDWPAFDTIDDAVTSAEQRSHDLGTGDATSVGGATVPNPDRRDTPSQPDNTSSAIWPDLANAAQSVGAAADTALSTASEALHTGANAVGETLEENPLYQSAVRGGMPDVVTIARKGNEGIEEMGFPGLVRRHNEMLDLEANPNRTPEEDARLEELRQSEEGLVMGASGTMGGGRIAEEAVNAIKALRAAGLEEVALQAERELAQKSSMTLDEVIKRVRGEVPTSEASVSTGEERTATSASATDVADSGVAAGDAGASVGSTASNGPANEGIRDAIVSAPTTPELPISAAQVERAVQQELPGMEEVPRRPVTEHVPGAGREREISQEARDILGENRTRYEASDAARPITWEESQAAAREVNLPEAQARTMARDPGALTAETTAIRTGAFGSSEAAAQAERELLDLRREIGNADPTSLPREDQERLAAAVAHAAAMREEAGMAGQASSRQTSSVARAFTSLRMALNGSQALEQVNRMRALFGDMKAAAEELATSAKAGGLTPTARKMLERTRDRLANPRERVTGPSDAVQEEIERVATAAREARKRGGGRGTGEAASAPPKPQEESFAEKLGRLKRELGQLTDQGAPPAARGMKQSEIDGVLAEIRLDAADRANRAVSATKRPLTQAETEKIVNESVGRPAVSRIRREEMERAKGFDIGKLQHSLDATLGKKLDAEIRRQERFASNLQQSTDRAIQRALDAEKRAAVRKEVDDMAMSARDIQTAIRRNPSDESLRNWMDGHLRMMEEHSNTGEKVSRQLRAQFDRQIGQDSKRFMAGVEASNLRRAQKAYRVAKNQADKKDLDWIQANIDEVLRHPDAPGATKRFEDLSARMAEVSTAGYEKQATIREQIHRANLMKAGLSVKGTDITPVLTAFRAMDPSDPSSVRAALATLKNPQLHDYWHELQYVNMLSDPRTALRNVSGNALQSALLLLVRNPIESVVGKAIGADTGGARQALVGYGKGIAEAAPRALSIMRHGVDPARVEAAIEDMSISKVNREFLTERLDGLGTALHFLSTRPLEAMDVLLGHAMYASRFEQEVDRTASRLMREKADVVAGLGKEQAMDYVRRNVWDYPQIFTQAEKIRDYTLLRGKGDSRAETALRNVISLRNPDQQRSTGDKIVGAIIDFALPFSNVPINFAKQGLERTLFVPIDAGKGALELARGNKREAAEHFAKASVGAGMLTAGGILAAGDNLTGDGPTDPGQRNVWLIDHQPRSMRAPGTKTWMTWENTPWAIPFAAIAGAKEAMEQADLQGDKRGWDDSRKGAAVLLGAGKGAFSGFASQTFLEGLQQNIEALTLQGAGPGALSTALANTANRYSPAGLIAPSGFVGMLARMTDAVDRDVGRPDGWAANEIGQNAAERVALRIPGLRQQEPERTNAFGIPVQNPSQGLAAVSPVRASSGQGNADPELEGYARKLEDLGIGIPDAPSEITFAKIPIALTQEDQRLYQRTYGQTMLDLMRQFKDEQFTAEEYGKLRDMASKQAKAEVYDAIGGDEIVRRWEERGSRIQHPVR
jgi:hypothetical protein